MLKTALDTLRGTFQIEHQRQSTRQALTSMAGVANLLQLRPLSLAT